MGKDDESYAGIPEGYSDESFWDKIKKYARVAGREVVEKSLWLYYAAQRPGTPMWAKIVIYGALAYFICPIDAIPDVIPAVGFVDDLGALAGALVTVAAYIDDEVKTKTSAKLKNWFGTETSIEKT